MKDSDWADSNTWEGKADLPVTWSQTNLLEPAHMTKTVVLKWWSKRSQNCIKHCQL